MLGRAGQRGQKRRLADAADGTVAWRSPTEIQLFIEQFNFRLREEAMTELERLQAEGKLERVEAAKVKQSLTDMTEEEILADMFSSTSDETPKV